MRLSIFLLLLTLCNARAQNTFIQTLDMPGNSEQTEAIVTFDNGDFITANNLSATNIGYLSKFDSVGNKFWTKQLTYNNAGIRILRLKIFSSTACCGFGAGVNGTWVLFMLDTAGNPLWSRSYGVAGTVPVDLCATNNSSILVTGYYTDSTGLNTIVGHYSQYGTTISERKLHGASAPFGIIQLANSEIVIATHWHYMIYRHTMELIRLDTSLNVLAKVEFRKDSLLFPTGTGIAASGNSIILGMRCRDSAAVWSSYLCRINSLLSPTLICRSLFQLEEITELNTNGEFAGSAYLSTGFSLYVIDTAFQVQSGAAFSYAPWYMRFRCGTPYNDGFLVGGDSEWPGPTDKSLIMRVDHLGHAGCLFSPLQAQTVIDSLTFTIVADSADQLSLPQNALLINVTNATPVLQIFCNTTSIEEQRENASGLFPNPASTGMTIWAIENIRSYQIYSSSGQPVSSEYGLSTRRLELNLSGLDCGVYYISLDIDGTIREQRIVIAR
jgi:hypothetical protein